MYYSVFISFLFRTYCREKKPIDIEKPLMSGAFVDPSKITQYKEDDYILPEIPPLTWFIKNPKVTQYDRYECTLVSIIKIKTVIELNLTHLFVIVGWQVAQKTDEDSENDKSSVNSSNGKEQLASSADQKKNVANNNNNNNNMNNIINNNPINNNIMNNNNNNSNDTVAINNINNNQNGDAGSHNDAMTTDDKHRFRSSRTLSREDDRILKEMVMLIFIIVYAFWKSATHFRFN